MMRFVFFLHYAELKKVLLVTISIVMEKERALAWREWGKM